MTSERSQNIAFLTLFAAIAVLLYFVFAPFLQIIILAAVFAFLLQKPYEHLVVWLEGSRSFAAAVVVFLTLVFCIVPLFILGTQIFAEAQTTYLSTPGAGAAYIQTLQDSITHFAQRIYPDFTFNAGQYIGNALTFISSNLTGLVSETVYIVFQTFLMLMAFFFFLRDGSKLANSVRDSSPFGPKETNAIFKSVYQTTSAVLKGTLLVALVRWVIVGFAFYVFGVPNAILWGSIGGIVGAIPGLGTLIVLVPAALYLYLQGNIIGAVGLAVVALIIIALVDNLLTTYFFGKGLEVPDIFVLFSILGGIIYFGPIGFVLGPLVLSIFVALFKIYSETNAMA